MTRWVNTSQLNYSPGIKLLYQSVDFFFFFFVANWWTIASKVINEVTSLPSERYFKMPAAEHDIPTKIFIGNLSFDTDEKKLREVFGKMGRIEEGKNYKKLRF